MANPTSGPQRPILPALVAALAVAVAVGACADQADIPLEPPTPDESSSKEKRRASIDEYFLGLPPWSEFSPRREDVDPTPDGPPAEQPDDSLVVPVIDDDGNVLQRQQVYACTVTPYTMTANPEKLVMYNPDREILWPGGLIQGASHRDGQGSLLALPIKQRAPLRVSIPSLATDDNFREVADPDLANVSQAIGSMIGGATTDGLRAPSAIAFTMREYNSETEFALSAGHSAHAFDFEVSSKGDLSRSASETTIAAHFVERLFEVVVEPPATPVSFFSEEFTLADLQQQIDLGKIGPDNIPVFVSNVVYGRMMTFAMTSTASADEVRATLNASYDGLFKGSLDLSAKQKKILSEARISVASLGGDGAATAAMIRSGDWRSFFEVDPPLSAAAPLSYTFRNLRDGTIATVSETTEYNIRECEVKSAAADAFRFLPGEFGQLAIGVPASAVFADVNGDNLQDIVWNHRRVGVNEIQVGLSAGDGTFTVGPRIVHPASERWSRFYLRVGDVDGDGRDDLVWNATDLDNPASNNRIFVGFSDGQGGFAFTPRQDRSGSTWPQYVPEIGDMNGDGEADLVWYSWPNQDPHLFVAMSNGDGTFGDSLFHTDTISTHINHPFHALADVNSDGADDFLWLDRGHVQAALGRATNRPALKVFEDPDFRDDAEWTVLVGHVGGSPGADLVFSGQKNTATRVSVMLSSEDGQFRDAKTVDLFPGFVGDWVGVHGPDVNGDGRMDIMWNDRTTGNRVVVAYSDPEGTPIWVAAEQRHPFVTDWRNFVVLTGDVTGDGRDDVVWNDPAAENRIFVAVARGPGD